MKKYFKFLFFGLSISVILLIFPLHSHARDSHDPRCIEEIQAFFQKIEKMHLDGDRSEDSEQKALSKILHFLDGGLPKENGACAAEVIYKTIDIASRIKQRQQLLDRLANQAYQHSLEDSLIANQALFVLSLATVELNRGDFNAAKLLVDSTFTYPVEVRMKRQIASSYIIRGYTMEGLQHYKAAFDDFLKAFEYYRASDGNIVEQIGAVNSAALAAIKLEQYEESKKYLDYAMSLIKEYPDLIGKMPEAYTIWLNIAKIEFFIGSKKAAFDAAGKALKIAESRNDAMRIARSKMIIGELAFYNKDFSLSKRYSEQALKILEGTDDKRFEAEVIKTLSLVEKNSGNYKHALLLSERYTFLIDSLNQATHFYEIKNIQRDIASARIKQALATAEAKTIILKAKQKQGRYVKFAIGSVLLALISFLVAALTKLRSRKKSEARLESEVAKRTMEIEKQKEALRVKTEKLRKSNQELERFAYVASHDLKSPVRNISSFLGLIKRRLPTDSYSEVSDYFKIIQDSCIQMNALISDILDFSKIEANISNKYEKISLRGLVDNVVLQMGEYVKSRGAMVKVSGSAVLTAPPTYISQLLANLIENGLKYNQSDLPWVKIDIISKEDIVEIKVIDNGIGIAEEHQSSVFEMFKRLHANDTYKGTGVGLAVCAKIAHKMGGSITLHSVPNEGSCFTVLLPQERPVIDENLAREISEIASAQIGAKSD